MEKGVRVKWNIDMKTLAFWVKQTFFESICEDMNITFKYNPKKVPIVSSNVRQW